MPTKNENQPESPALADHGMFRSGTKFDMCMFGCICINEHTDDHVVIIKVLDMGIVIHIARPARAATFKE